MVRFKVRIYFVKLLEMVRYFWIFLIKVLVVDFDAFKANEINLESSTPPRPDDVKLISINTSTLLLTWSKPADSNETLIGFNITSDEIRTFVNESTTSLSITNLTTPGKYYTVNISAYYADFGNSEYVNASNYTFPSTPNNLTIASRGTNWLNISYENRGVSDACFAWAENATGSNGSCSAQLKVATITNLPVAGREYTIGIIAESGSLKSSDVTTKQRTSPPNPELPYCNSTTNASLTITIGPQGDSFEIDGYTISINSQIPSFNYSINRIVNATKAQPGVEFLGLKAGVTYAITAKTRIKDLVSNGENSSNCTTELNPPMNVRLNNTSERVIVISWDTPQGNFDGFNASCDGQNAAKDVFSVLYWSPGQGNLTSTTCNNVTAGALYAVTISTFLNQTMLTSAMSADPVWITTDPLPPRNVTAYPNDANSIRMDLLYGFDVSESQCTGYEIQHSNKTDLIPCRAELLNHSLSNLQPDSMYNINTYALSNYSYNNGLASLSSRSRSPVQTVAWTLAPPVTNITGNESLPWSLEVTIGQQPIYKNVWQYVIHVTDSKHSVQRIHITCSDATKMTFSEVNCQWRDSLSVLNWTDTCSTGLVVFNITDLRPYTNYTVSVQAVNPGGCSQSESIVLLTNESTPLCVNIANTSANISTVEVKWNACSEPNGVITAYQITYSSEERHDLNVTYTNETFVTLHGLNAYVNYTIKVAAVNRAGVGTYEGCSHSTVTVRTLIGTPFTPQLTVTPQTPRSALISWNSSDVRRTGPETYYNLTITDVRNSTLVIYEHVIGFDNRSVVVEGLDEFWNYSVAIVAYTINENDEELATAGTEIVYFHTNQSTPGPVSSFDVTSLSHEEKCYMVKLTWKEPNERELNGIITQYVIQWNQDNGNDSNSHNVSAVMLMTTVPVEPDDKKYNFTIRAQTIAGEGVPQTQILLSTGSCLPTPVENVSSILMAAGEEKSTTTSFPVILDPKFFRENKNGDVKQTGLFVREVSDKENLTAEEETGDHSLYTQAMTWSEAIKNDKIPEYRATGDNWQPGIPPKTRMIRSPTSQYTIGENAYCSKDVNDTCNGPLKPNRTYRVRAIICTEKGCYKTEYSIYIYKTKRDQSDSKVWIAGVVIGILVILSGLILVYFCLIRRTPDLCAEKPQEQTEINVFGSDKGHRITSRPIRLDNFKELITIMHRDSDLLFSDEYREIQEKSPKYPWTEAEQDLNKAKNRFINILPFDNSRVKLEQLQSGSDYTNASYIRDGMNRREYVASQGPLQTTMGDFWQMIWQEMSTVIVMLTNLKENGRVKCEQYWPSNLHESIQFGLVSVTMTEEQDFTSYMLRRFTVKVKGDSRQVMQFHFVAWPDFGVPAQPQTLIGFVKEVRKCIGHRIEPPTIVHCSAGVGRTGTFIALDRLLRQVNNSSSIDVFGTVLQLRECRCQMVQTETQYVFIYDCMSLEIERTRNTESPYESAYNKGYDFASEPLYQNQDQLTRLSALGRVL